MRSEARDQTEAGLKVRFNDRPEQFATISGIVSSTTNGQIEDKGVFRSKFFGSPVDVGCRRWKDLTNRSLQLAFLV